MHTAVTSLGSAVGVPSEPITAISLALSANQPYVVTVVATISDRLRTKKKARHRTPIDLGLRGRGVREHVCILLGARWISVPSGVEANRACLRLA